MNVLKSIKKTCNLKKENLSKNSYLYRVCSKNLDIIKMKKKSIIGFFKNDFILEKKNNTYNKGLMTGYYEPELRVYNKYRKDSYPIYKNPKKYGEEKLYQKSRKEINEGALNEKGLEIAWAESEIEVFFLQIQGSGRLKFPNGNIVKIKYSGSNEKNYTSIGKYLIDNKKIKKEKVSMYSIKNWLYNNKSEARKVMEENKRYIYFEEYKGNIKGGLKIDLEPLTSIAVDPKYHEPGSIFIIENESNKKFFFSLAHDSGKAIKGKNRIDLFTGYGKQAEFIASNLKAKVNIWKLIPK
ncbi:MAG: hypothetical protein CMP40_00390 [Rickettsiales bacterium]|nr:hypothetical protein [Rickettsiales bacterium]